MAVSELSGPGYPPFSVCRGEPRPIYRVSRAHFVLGRDQREADNRFKERACANCFFGILGALNTGDASSLQLAVDKFQEK
jgi:hypothetical protein